MLLASDGSQDVEHGEAGDDEESGRENYENGQNNESIKDSDRDYDVRREDQNDGKCDDEDGDLNQDEDADEIESDARQEEINKNGDDRFDEHSNSENEGDAITDERHEMNDENVEEDEDGEVNHGRDRENDADNECANNENHERDNDKRNRQDQDHTDDGGNGDGYEAQVPSLPYLALRRIIFYSIRASPLMRYTLQMVNPEFANIVREFGYPAIYIRPSQMIDLPSTVSVNRLCRIYGSHNGLMLRIRNLLSGSGGRWFRAWLTLRDVRGGWFEIMKVAWR